MGEIMVLAPSSQQTGTGRALTGEMQSRLDPDSFRENYLSVLNAAGGESIRPFQGHYHATLCRGGI